jgi:hypothetical protein
LTRKIVEMTHYYLTYSDIDELEPRKSFELTGPPPQLLAEDHVIPGLRGFKPIYIRWYHQRLGPDQLHLVTYTYNEPRAVEVEYWVVNAFKCIQDRN